MKLVDLAAEGEFIVCHLGGLWMQAVSVDLHQACLPKHTELGVARFDE